jgi:hypothetical protein
MQEPTKTPATAAILTPSIQISLSRIAVGDAAHANIEWAISPTQILRALIFRSLSATPVNSGENRGAE